MMPYDSDFREDVIDRLARIEEHVRDIPARVSELEKWRNRLVGAVAAIGAYLTYIGKHQLASLISLFS